VSDDADGENLIMHPEEKPERVFAWPVPDRAERCITFTIPDPRDAPNDEETIAAFAMVVTRGLQEREDRLLDLLLDSD